MYSWLCPSPSIGLFLTLVARWLHQVQMLFSVTARLSSRKELSSPWVYILDKKKIPKIPPADFLSHSMGQNWVTYPFLNNNWEENSGLPWLALTNDQGRRSLKGQSPLPLEFGDHRRKEVERSANKSLMSCYIFWTLPWRLLVNNNQFSNKVVESVSQFIKITKMALWRMHWREKD